MPGSRTATAVMNAAANGAKSTPCGCTPRWSMTGRCHSPHRRPSAAPAPRVPRNRGRSRGQAYQRAGQLVGLGQGGRGRLVVPAVGVDGAEDDAGEADDADLLTCSPVRSRQDLAAGGGSRAAGGSRGTVPRPGAAPAPQPRPLGRHRRPPSPRPESFASELGPAGSARRRGQRPSPPPVHRCLGVAATWKASCRLKRSAVGRVAGPVHREQLPVAFDALEQPRSAVVQGCARPSRQRRRRVARPRRRAARRESERRCREAGPQGRSRSAFPARGRRRWP